MPITSQALGSGQSQQVKSCYTHQIAGGMAHHCENTLTARGGNGYFTDEIANADDSEDLRGDPTVRNCRRVPFRIVEGSVRGQPQGSKPASLCSCLSDLEIRQRSVADALPVELLMRIDSPSLRHGKSR